MSRRKKRQDGGDQISGDAECMFQEMRMVRRLADEETDPVVRARLLGFGQGAAWAAGKLLKMRTKVEENNNQVSTITAGGIAILTTIVLMQPTMQAFH